MADQKFTADDLNAAQVRSAETLAVVFGDQLDRESPVLAELDRENDAVLMMEVQEEATHVPSHRQRTTLFLSAMRHFALDLMNDGYRVRYIRLDDSNNTTSFDDAVRHAVDVLNPERLLMLEPGEHRVRKVADNWGSLDVELDIHEDESFLADHDTFDDWADSRDELIMEYFYRKQRKRLDILVKSDGDPVGGQWNFDKENRKSFKKSGPDKHIESPRRFRPDDITKAVIETVNKTFPDAYGKLDHFYWPVTRKEARTALRDFLDNRLENFGDYQDAMWTDEPWLNHSLLSPVMNLKLLSPREIIEATLERHESDAVPLNSLEGFLRQIIGSREFIRGVYFHEGPKYADGNGLDQHGALPGFYWTGDTDMNCMRQCLGQVVEHGYGHHIQRLMVTGNFALVSGIHPRAISDWYLGMYVDGVDWVTRPNTHGMVMHADGGVVGTKPYAASGSYINRMSNYCKSCRYDVKQRTGDDACPFNTFYWDFLARNKKRFKDNRRMGLMLKNFDRIDRSEKVQLTISAKKRREELDIGDIDG